MVISDTHDTPSVQISQKQDEYIGKVHSFQGQIQRSRDFLKGGRSISPTMVGHEKGFIWSKKTKITLETISFWRNISISIFQIFSDFIYTETLPMKSYQFLKIYKRFDEKREKTLIQQSTRKKTEKSWTLFYNRLFYKTLKNDN